MPVARFQMPDGRIARFEVPEGTTPEQAQAMIAEQVQPTTQPQQPAASPLDGMSRFDRLAAGTGKAVVDVGRGLKQRLDEAAVGLESITPGAEAINRFIGGPTAAQIQQRGQQSAAESRRMDAPLMSDGWGIAGNVAGGAVMAAPLAALGPVGAGVASGFMQPTTGGAGEVLGNMGIGGAGGYVGDKLIKGVSRVIKPNSSPEVQALMREGVTPTPGQILGGNFNRAEEKAMSLPFVGDAIASSRRRAAGELNTAVANRALSPIGQSLPKGITGREAVQYVDDTLGAAYDKLLPKLTVRADQQFTQQVGGLRNMVATGSIDPNAAKMFERILKGDVLGKFKGQNALTGQTIKQIEGDLGQKIAQLGGSTDADARLVADALKEVQSALRGAVQRSNPAQAKELQAINTGWANFKRMQRAASGVGAEDGIFDASQLQSAVKALDRSKDKGRFAKGDALMQDLSDNAKKVLGAKIPNSGTADRLMNAGAIGAGIVNPAIPLGLAGGAAAYSAPVQRLIAAMLAQRPNSAGLLANEVRSIAPLGGLLGIGSAGALAQ